MPLDPANRNKLAVDVHERGSVPAAGSGFEPLTPREFEVVQFLAHGLSDRGIAHELARDDRTVQAHLTSVFAKMGVTSRVNAALEAIRRGWLTF